MPDPSHPPDCRPLACLSRAVLLALLAAACHPTAAAERLRPPRVLHLSPRRMEQIIDARGHDRLLLRARADGTPFRVTVLLADLMTGRVLDTIRLRTDGRAAVSVPAPLPVFRTRLWSSASREFDLEMTLR